MYLEDLPRRLAVKAQNVYRISGIIWSCDPAGVNEFRQTDEYDSYALKIVEFDPLSVTDLRSILEQIDILTESLVTQLSIYLGI